jgi:tetratricopeptide (TPR) repeat protein
MFLDPMIEAMAKWFPALIIFSLALAAQDRDSLLGQIDAERRAGHAAAVEPLLEQLLALDEQRAGASSVELVPTLDQLARIAVVSAKYDHAEEIEKRVLAIMEAASDATSPQLLTPLGNLVRLYNIAGRYSDAESVLLRAVAIRVKAQGAARTPLRRSNEIRSSGQCIWLGFGDSRKEFRHR